MRHFGFGMRYKIGVLDVLTPRGVIKKNTSRFLYLELFKDLKCEDVRGAILL
jgi:hypothetical protein